jgi:hypothetical protein
MQEIERLAPFPPTAIPTFGAFECMRAQHWNNQDVVYEEVTTAWMVLRDAPGVALTLKMPRS